MVSLYLVFRLKPFRPRSLVKSFLIPPVSTCRVLLVRSEIPPSFDVAPGTISYVIFQPHKGPVLGSQEVVALDFPFSISASYEGA